MIATSTDSGSLSPAVLLYRSMFCSQKTNSSCHLPISLDHDGLSTSCSKPIVLVAVFGS